MLEAWVGKMDDQWLTAAKCPHISECDWAAGSSPGCCALCVGASSACTARAESACAGGGYAADALGLRGLGAGEPIAAHVFLSLGHSMVWTL